MTAQPTTPGVDQDSAIARAGYGCVICGSPVVTLVRLGERDLVLCPEHRTLYETDRLADDLDAALEDPYNLKHDLASGSLRMSSRYPALRLGDVIIVNEGPIVVADDDPLVSLRALEGRLVVSLRLYDSEDNLLLDIVDNEWLHGEADDFVITHEPNTLVIAGRDGSVIFRLNTSVTPLNLTAHLMKASAHITIRSKGLYLDGNRTGFRDDASAGCFVAIDTAKLAVEMQPSPQNGGHAIIVTESDPVQRLVKTLNAMASLRSHIEDDPLQH